MSAVRGKGAPPLASKPFAAGIKGAANGSQEVAGLHKAASGVTLHSPLPPSSCSFISGQMRRPSSQGVWELIISFQDRAGRKRGEEKEQGVNRIIQQEEMEGGMEYCVFPSFKIAGAYKKKKKLKVSHA